eukprot:5738701-Lingulodinium_polyedra.AAC.1
MEEARVTRAAEGAHAAQPAAIGDVAWKRQRLVKLHGEVAANRAAEDVKARAEAQEAHAAHALAE